jgi:ribosomal-protein-alanine N-acetyltransferase
MPYVRNANRGDLDAILEIEKLSYKKPWDKRAFMCEFSKQDAGMNIFVVYYNEETCGVEGYACGNIVADYIHILNVSVAPGYRRKGAAGKMLGHIEAEAFQRGLGSMTLELCASNGEALDLYKKRGFSVSSRREKAIDNSEDELIMWKKIL